jgi:ubiquinone/menaquinone biosynthesis C-methylase UbiE
MNFDEDAKTWDTELRINRARKVAEHIKESIEINKNLTAMEFGCGTGLVSFNLYEEFKSIVLVDESKGMIDTLNSKLEKYKGINMVAYNLEDFNKNLADKKYDVIYNSMVLHHIMDYRAMIKNFHELLNQEGYLCIVDLDEEDGSFHKDHPDYDGHNGFNQGNLKKVLIEAGFKDVVSSSFYHDIKTIGDEKVNYSLFLMTGRKY